MEAQGDSPRAIGLLEEAIAADPDFAMAHRRLGVVLSNRAEDPARMRAALQRAYDLRHRLTDAERYLTIAVYNSYVTHDIDRSIEAYRNLLDLHPYDGTALNNLGVTYSNRGDYERALDAYNRAIAVDSFNAFPATNIVSTLYNLGRIDEARAAYDRAARRFPAHQLVARGPVQFASADGDYDAVLAALQAAAENTTEDPARQIGRLNALAAEATIRGRLAEAEDLAQQAGRLDERRRGASARIFAAADGIFHDVTLRNNPDRARSRLAAALARDPLDSIEPLERPYGLLAAFHVLTGTPDSTRHYLARAGGSTSDAGPPPCSPSPSSARATPSRRHRLPHLPPSATGPGLRAPRRARLRHRRLSGLPRHALLFPALAGPPVARLHDPAPGRPPRAARRPRYRRALPCRPHRALARRGPRAPAAGALRPAGTGQAGGRALTHRRCRPLAIRGGSRPRC
jgi:tetratricopeptide (TPR) repeat protein